jgi:predicted DNA-binding protein
MAKVTASKGRPTGGNKSVKGRKLQVCVAYPPGLIEQLKALSKDTRVPMAAYYQEALEDLLRKHAAVLRRVK